jgi:FMN phosphatase YigB (HAD superfamily)
MVKRLHIVVLLGIACALGAHIAMDTELKPHNTVLCFDLHDVVLKPDTAERLKLAVKNPLRTLGLAFDVTSRKGVANGEEYAVRLKKKGLIKQAELVHKFSSAYKVDTDVFDILKTLKAKGYRVCMASNIGAQNLNDLFNPSLSKKGKNQTTRMKVREVVESFDDIISVDYESQNVITKPSHDYFKIVQDSCGHDKHVIFVDDKKKNVDAANACGLDGIRFTSAKQLKQDLEKRRIL